jgi:hypothetical protein
VLIVHALSQAVLPLNGQQMVRVAGNIILCFGSLPLFGNVLAIKRRGFDPDAVKHAVDNSMQSIGVCLLMTTLFA